MTENITSPDYQGKASITPASKKTLKPKRRFAFKKWLGALFLLLLTAAAIILIYRLWSLQNNLLMRNQNVLAALNTTQKQLQELKLNVTSLHELSTQQQTELSHNQAELQQVMQRSLHSNQDWTLSEVRYLLRLAQLNINFLHDLTAAKALLETADQDIQNLNDASLGPIRAALAKDIAQIQTINRVDIEGVLTRIQALGGQISQLPLIVIQPSAKLTASANTHFNHWQQALRSSLTQLRKLIVIRRTEQMVSPLVAPEQRFYLEANLYLLLNKAELALLHNQPALYRSSLQQAAALIQRYFSTQALPTQNVLSALAELQQTELTAQLPSLEESVKTLNQIMSKRNKINNDIPKEALPGALDDRMESAPL